MDKTGFIAYLEGKDLSPTTQKTVLRGTKLFLDWAGKEDVQVTKPDILEYLEYLKNRGLQNVSRKLHLMALKHYFGFLCHAGLMAKNPCSLLKIRGARKKVLYTKIYTPEELEQLFDSYYQLYVRSYDVSHIRGESWKKYATVIRERNTAILSILLNQGVITSEIGKIEIEDLDLGKATLRIRGAKNHNERTIPLKALQIGILMHYLQDVRPQLLEHQNRESDKLFLSMPGIRQKKTDSDLAKCIFTPLSAQMKTLDKQFLNFLQVRASVITSWLKTHGLRKAQYLAGHKHVISTEEYLANNLDGLTEDITKLHPF